MATTKPDDAQMGFFATRTLEIMGGRELAIASMEAEYNTMKERWNQDVSTIGRILRSHLHVEYYMTEHLQHANHSLGDLEEARLSFAQKMNLLNPGDPMLRMLIGGIRHLNKIRNRLAHNLSATVTDEDAQFFLSQSLFKVMRDEGAKGKVAAPSSDPLDILEAFAEFVSAMLHDAATPYSKALQQAMGEWDFKNGIRK
ncbi:hypothetical protein [Rhodoferax sp. GW822-FHT02A01]|uniref:hypothetical protein n=1 Tax=Rhodoferax sp. GW822-FHT02A01 TaxID=3141537 RepID=UPI00315CD0C6